MKLLLIILLLAAGFAFAEDLPRKVGDYFVVGYDTGNQIEGDGLSPNGELAIVVTTNKNVGLPVPKGDGPSPYSAYLIETDSRRILWETPVNGDFSWGPLTSMVTCNWHPESKGFWLRLNMGRMMSETRLYLKTSSGEWKLASIEKSPFEASDYFQKLHSRILTAGTSWDKKHSPPNTPGPGFRQFGDWIERQKILVWESYGGDLIYRFDDQGRLFLIGYDPDERFVEQDAAANP